jgi:hypothetical protein
MHGRTLRRLSSATAALTLGIALTQTHAVADPGPLPFTPPAGWQPVPSAMIPDLLLSWLSGSSSFGVTRVSFPIADSQLTQALKAGSSALGTEISSSSDPVCGAPSARAVIKVEDSSEILSEQMQSLDGATYVSVYRHPASVKADHAIEAFMGSFCGSKSLERKALPAGWHSLNAKLLGIWFSPKGPGESVAALSRDPQPDLKSWATFAVNTTVNPAAITIHSDKTGTLCGNPAYFFNATAKPHGAPEADIQMAATQSSSSSFMLLYSHPATSAADPAAVASLSTLCAAPHAVAVTRGID